MLLAGADVIRCGTAGMTTLVLADLADAILTV